MLDRVRQRPRHDKIVDIYGDMYTDIYVFPGIFLTNIENFEISEKFREIVRRVTKSPHPRQHINPLKN